MALSGTEEVEYYGFGPRYENFDYSTDTIDRRTISYIFKRDVDLVKNKAATSELKRLGSLGWDGLAEYWSDCLYGIPRIGVHGTDTICVAVRKEDVVSLVRQVRQGQVDDPARHMFSNAQNRSEEECWSEYLHDQFMKAVLSEVEELGLKSSKILGIKRPFYLVTTVHGHESEVVNREGGSRFRSANNFLNEEVAKKKSITFTETLKAAVAALQVLFGKKFEADEIEVYYLTRGDGTTKVFRRLYDDVFMEDSSKDFVERIEMEEYSGEWQLPTFEERSVEDYLSVINKEVSCSLTG